MSYSKFGSIVNSDEGITLAVVEEAITYAVNENNKRIKLMSDGWDYSERGFNLISTNPFPGPEMTLRTLVPGDGIEISTVNEGQDLRITNTGSSETGANFFHEDGVCLTTTFCLWRKWIDSPTFSLYNIRVIEVKGITDRVTVTPGVPWRFHQSGYNCTLNVGAFVLGNQSNGSPLEATWALGYEEQKGEPIPGDPSENVFILPLGRLPLSSKPIASHMMVQLTSADVTTLHYHGINFVSGSQSSGNSHTHRVDGYTHETAVTYSLGVSILSFDENTGDIQLLLRNLSSTNIDMINLLKLQRISAFTLTWVTENAVNGSPNPNNVGVILSNNGITANTNVTARLDFFDSWINVGAVPIFDMLQQQIAAEAQARSETDSTLTDALVGKASNQSVNEIATHVQILDETLSSTGTILETNGLTEDSNVTAQIESLTTDLSAKVGYLEMENRLSTKLETSEYNRLTLNSTEVTGTSLVHSTSARPIFKVKGLTASNGVRLDATLNEVNVSLEPSITTAISNALVEITQSFSAVFGWADNGGTTATVTCFISKIGSQVQLSIPTFMVNSGNVQRNTLPSSLATPIPAAFRPAIACNVGMCVMTTAATRTVGLLWVNTIGDMLFYRDATNAVWLSGITAIGPSPRTSCFSWSTAAI